MLTEKIRERLQQASKKYGQHFVIVSAVEIISIFLCVFFGIMYLICDNDFSDTILLIKLLQVPIVLFTNIILGIIAIINMILGICKKESNNIIFGNFLCLAELIIGSAVFFVLFLLLQGYYVAMHGGV